VTTIYLPEVLMSAVDETVRETTVDVAAEPTLGCKTYSWSPEVHDLYGDAEAILEKVDTMDMHLDDRRVYALVIAGEGSAEVRFFEQVDAENWAVLSWQGADLDGLHGRLAETVLANRGIHCVGEQVKALLTGAVDLELQGIVPAPTSPRAAFAHTLRAHGTNKFIRATTALLC